MRTRAFFQQFEPYKVKEKNNFHLKENAPQEVVENFERYANEWEKQWGYPFNEERAKNPKWASLQK